MRLDASLMARMKGLEDENLLARQYSAASFI